MRIGTDHGGLSLNPDSSARTRGVKQTGEAVPAATSSSLVAMETPAAQASAQYRTTRVLATFVTQLIAKSQDMPATRVRRRADPAEGAKIYKDMSDIGGVPKRYKLRPF